MEDYVTVDFPKTLGFSPASSRPSSSSSSPHLPTASNPFTIPLTDNVIGNNSNSNSFTNNNNNNTAAVSTSPSELVLGDKTDNFHSILGSTLDDGNFPPEDIGGSVVEIVNKGRMLSMEPEPLLEYSVVGGDVPGILQQETCTALCVDERFVIMGTNMGRLHLLDFNGNQIRCFEHHMSDVTDISFDESKEFLASSSIDGTVVVSALFDDTTTNTTTTATSNTTKSQPTPSSTATTTSAVTPTPASQTPTTNPAQDISPNTTATTTAITTTNSNNTRPGIKMQAKSLGTGLLAVRDMGLDLLKGTQSVKVSYDCGVASIALDPKFNSSSLKNIAVGCTNGHVIVNSPAWLRSRKDQILQSKEVSVKCVRWSGSYIAWAGQQGVKIYNYRTGQRVGFMRFSADPLPENGRVFLTWDGPNTLIVGWGDRVKIATVRAKGDEGSGNTVTPEELILVNSFTTDYVICGLVCVGPFLAVLAHVRDTDFSFHSHKLAQEKHRPEIRILSRDNEEFAVDAIELPEQGAMSPMDYSMQNAADGVCYVWCHHHVITVDLKPWLAWASDRLRESVSRDTRSPSPSSATAALVSRAVPSLWRRLGGIEAVQTVAHTAVTHTLADPLITHAIQNSGDSKLMQCVRDKLWVSDLVDLVSLCVRLWAGEEDAQQSLPDLSLPATAREVFLSDTAFVVVQYHTLCAMHEFAIAPAEQRDLLQLLTHARALIATPPIAIVTTTPTTTTTTPTTATTTTTTLSPTATTSGATPTTTTVAAAAAAAGSIQDTDANKRNSK